MDNDEKIKEYEAHKTPVPSYEELQNMNEAVNECMAANIKLVEQNRKLKELLKECVEYVKKDYGDYLTYTQSAIYQEINQVLGDKING